MMCSEQGLAHRKFSINVSGHYKQRMIAYFSNGLLPLHHAVLQFCISSLGQQCPKLSKWLCGACQSDTDADLDHITSQLCPIKTQQHDFSGPHCPSSGCYNTIPQTKCLINNLNLFLILLDTGKSKIKVGADSVSGESLVYGGYHLSLISYHRRGGGTLGICFIRALTLFMWVLSS